MYTVKYELHFFSDYQIGTGLGIPGFVDNFCEKDEKGRLFVHRRTIKGNLRDAAMKIAAWYPSLFPACTGDMSTSLCLINGFERPCPICRIFGSSAVEARFHFEDAVYPEPHKEIIARDDDPLYDFLRDRQAKIRSRSAIEKKLRRAQENFLFSTEECFPITGYFEGKIIESKDYFNTLRRPQLFTDGERTQDKNLLTMSLRLITELGGGRRKGAGWCRFKDVEIIEDGNVEKAGAIMKIALLESIEG